MPRKSSDSMDQTIMPAKSSAIIPPIDCRDKHRAPFVVHPNPNATDPVPSGKAHTIHCNRLHQAPLNTSPFSRSLLPNLWRWFGYSQSKSRPSKPCLCISSTTDCTNLARFSGSAATIENFFEPSFHPPTAANVFNITDYCVLKPFFASASNIA
uniref:Uncharacterized protein n=1 Tax=Glossina austeni TaxID=7395 RepID=A0A1A9V637_GLOAU